MTSETRLGSIVSRLSVPRRELVVYVAVVLAFGTVMNSLGKMLAIAEFKFWWQVGTCYVGYVLPAALLVRHMRAVDQLVFGLIAMVPLELAGYALGSSIAHPDNLLERAFGMRNFTLAMVVLVAPIPLVVNWLAERCNAKLGASALRADERESSEPSEPSCGTAVIVDES